MYDDFERLAGKRPWALVDRHPDGRHAAMLAPDDRAGVWDVEKKALVWDGGGDTGSIAWLPGGSELLAVRGEDDDYRLERLTWPELALNDRSELYLPGWLGGVAVAASDDAAAVVWVQQSDGGFVLVDLSTGVRQLRSGWKTKETNWLEVALHTRDWIAVLLNPDGATNWWGGEDDEDVSPGGTYAVADVVLLSTDMQEAWRASIEVDVPEGWHPGLLDPGRGVARPRFQNERQLVVDVTLSCERVIALPT